MSDDANSPIGLKQLASDRRPRAQRLAKLRDHDPAQAFLSLRVLDPAMGSGHFLVSLVDWLTDQALTAQQTPQHRSPGWTIAHR